MQTAPWFLSAHVLCPRMNTAPLLAPVAAIALILTAHAANGSNEAVSTGSGGRTVHASNDDTLRRALADAKPGDTILIASGEYRGVSASNVRGTPEHPIVIRGVDGEAAPTFTGTIHLTDPAHLELSGLRVAGAAANGVNIDDGGTFDSPAHHLKLRNLEIAGIGGTQNADGIKLSGVQDFVVEHCSIERWGLGGSAIDMVGCAKGVISDCAIRDPEGRGASSGVQAKGGSRDVAIRKCRFDHAGQRAINIGGSTGLDYFRPRPEGFEAKDILVEGCTFVGSQAPIAFVGVDGARVRFNTFIHPAKWIVRILQETTAPGFVPCRGGVFEDNLIVYRSSAVRVAVNVGSGTAPESFRFARNWWFAEDDPPRSVPALPTPEVDPAGRIAPRFTNLDETVQADPARTRGAIRQTAESPARKHGADAAP